nr:HlyD family type I secretion periplasmic adaptor subunit [Solimonas marina]
MKHGLVALGRLVRWSSVKEAATSLFPLSGHEPVLDDFQPGLLKIERSQPSPLRRTVLLSLSALIVLGLIVISVSHVEVVATAHGKVIPKTYVKIIQPASQGVIKEILVAEGQVVQEGQVLMRMDSTESEADRSALLTEYEIQQLTLRRIKAEIAGTSFDKQPGDRDDIFSKVRAEYLANVHAHENDIRLERAGLSRAKNDLAGNRETFEKLEGMLPSYRQEENIYEELDRSGIASKIQLNEKVRQRIQAEKDLKAQSFAIKSARAAIRQSEERLRQLESDYRRELQAKAVEVTSDVSRLKEQLKKNVYAQGLLELKAPVGGIIKNLETHSIGTVVSPGEIMMTLVPGDQPLVAEVWLSNEDVGFVRTGLPAHVKLATFEFQKYGFLAGQVTDVSADASDDVDSNGRSTRSQVMAGSNPFLYRTLIDLNHPYLEYRGKKLSLLPGMQVQAEIILGERTVLEYLLSPIKGTFDEAGRER